jgi:SAM-dependent methyltransferase
MNYKDNFSAQAIDYAKYRPKYPAALYGYLLTLPTERDLLWDCATGNGQAAEALAPYFKQVIATDASEAQIRQAVQSPNITYQVATAENSGLATASVSMITVAQAAHWFNHAKFYEEVRRVARPQAVLAIWGYGLTRIKPKIDKVIDYLYFDILGDKYWDAERTHLDNHYTTLPFEFTALDTPDFKMESEWNLADFTNYLHTWSSVQKYIRQNNAHPVALVQADLEKTWGDMTKQRRVIWDIYLKVGRVS